MMCHSIGLPPISTIGFGRTAVSSLSREPNPPAKITAFTRGDYSPALVEANVTEAMPAARLRTARLGRMGDWWQWAPLPIGAAYLLVLAVKFNDIVANVYLNADAASAPVIGELFGGVPGQRQVILGQMGWFSTLLFELATRSLPHHRQIWEGAPYAMALASVALIAWATWRVAGRWAAAITATLLVCAGPRTLTLLFSLNDHSTTWFSLALLAALLVLVEHRPAQLGRIPLALIVVVGGLVVGANAASDLVLVVAGLAPLLIAAAAAWALRPGRASASAWWWLLGTVVVAGIGDVLTRAWASHETVIVPPQFVHNKLASAEALSVNFKLWWQSLMVLGNGNFFGQTLGFSSTLELICALLCVIAVALIPRLGWRELQRVRTRHGDDLDWHEALRIAWCAFWGSSAVLLSMSFVFSSNPIDILSSRYLVGVIYAAAALVPLMAGRRLLLRAAVTAGATVFAFSGLVSLIESQEIAPAAGSYQLYNQVAQIVRREHLQVGYADYWDAAPIMWATRFGVGAYPVQDCAPNICWSYLHEITSWYVPRAGTRTFLIADPSQPIPAAPLPILGRASATYQVGPLTMYVYPYDIASHFQP
jgi:hypothetical protein